MQALLVGTLLALVSFGAGCSHAHWRPDYKVHREKLPNGLTVLYVEDHTAPVVSYTTWFKVGSAWEKPGSTGIAHLFEHMMFKGTSRYPARKFFEALESKGALVNAYTQRDSTVYYEVIAAKYLETVIDMESDRLANLLLTQADLDSERQVVKEERRLRVDSNFGAQQMESLEKLAFPTHPYGWPVIGYQEDLDRLSLKECEDFFRDYYQPGNAIVTIAGDFDYERAREWMTKYYGKLAGHPVRELALRDEKTAPGEKRLTIERPVEAESLLIGYYIPSMYSEDAERLSMLAWALFGMNSSRSNVELVRKKQLALGVGAEATLERYPSLFLVSAELKTGQRAGAVEEEIYKLIEEAKEKPLGEDELERVKNGLLYSTINESKSSAGVAGWLTSGEFYWNDHQRIFEKLDKYYAMKPEELRQVARKYLNKENRVVVVMKPQGEKP
ncbi:MAG: insulinase family protein [Deltaproteobacteria bacterium]|nr:insulinase family protein [Deltaproteobacteria bacterium]